MKTQNLKAKVKTQRYGFTVAEILLVVVIISLIASVGGGFYMGTYKRMLVEKAGRDFVLAAKYARIMAIEQQKPYRIAFDPNNNGFRLATTQENIETGEAQQVIVRDAYFKPVEFAGDVKFEGIQITPTGLKAATETAEAREIVFSPSGIAQSAVIQIGDGKNHYTVSISSATGKSAMYFGTAEKVKEEVRIGTIDLDQEL
ncbi:MAG: GspH/FimT family pseudopilin [Planctomycetota bacterium]|jgi:prepilin-type N-terminal cleavage/methylation domain-containing protein